MSFHLNLGEGKIRGPMGVVKSSVRDDSRSLEPWLEVGLVSGWLATPKALAIAVHISPFREQEMRCEM